MKILVLADIHSNWPALSAIRESFDVCLFAGDLVDYGTDPLPCIEWAKASVTAGIRGNHDHSVAQRIPAHGGHGYRRLAAGTRPVHWDLLNEKQLTFLRELPVTRYLTLNEQRFFLVHGTPHDPLDEYLSDDPETWRERLKSVDANFVIVGHTHMPFHLDLGHLQLINPGSVGQPRDGNSEASYAIIDNGTVHLRRVAYRIDETVQQMKRAGLSTDLCDLAESILRNGGFTTKTGGNQSSLLTSTAAVKAPIQ